MKILLTGACGILGRAIRRVAAGEHQLVLFDHAEQIENEGGIHASVTDGEAVDRAIEGCQAVIHTAALHGHFRGKRSNADFIQANVIGTESVFQAAINHHTKRLVIASTMGVLIGGEWGCFGTAELDESFPPRPDWIYPVTKYQVEVLGHFYARYHGLEVAQLRYMAFDDRSLEQLGLSLLSRYTTADDAARATLLAATVAGIHDEVLHIGPETPLRQRDINDAVNDPDLVLERHWPGSAAILRSHGITPTSANFWPVTRIERAKRVLGWQPRDTFEKYLSQLGWRRER